MNAITTGSITVSLVSHGHDLPVANLVRDLLAETTVARLVLTLNLPQSLDLADNEKLIVINNTHPKGFGQNHNQAFTHCQSPYFLVLNPDVGFEPGVFAKLATCQAQTAAAIVAPAVVSAAGVEQDSWRQFPTLAGLVKKALGHDTSVVKPEAAITYPDWVAGMCMMFEQNAYRQLKGFDERYHLYYEDVDICARAWLRGYQIVGCSTARLTHDAQRASRRQWNHLRWHLKSMLRYLLTYRTKLKSINKPSQSADQ